MTPFEPAEPPESPRKKILIVDDDENIRSLLREILGEYCFDLFEAEDGQDALDIIHANPIDLLILDRVMPRLDGLGLLRILREENYSIPVVVISAYGDENLWASAIGLGADDYLLKPFSNETVMKLVRTKLA